MFVKYTSFFLDLFMSFIINIAWKQKFIDKSYKQIYHAFYKSIYIYMKLIFCIHIHPHMGLLVNFFWLFLFICKQKELVMMASESVVSIIISQL